MSGIRGVVLGCLMVAGLGGAAGAQVAPEAASPAGATPAVVPPADTVMLHQSTTVLGQAVRSEDGKATGRIVDVLVDAESHPRAAVIDFGGFLGLGTRRLAVDWTRVHFATGSVSTPATVDLTIEQLGAAPDYKETKGPVPVLAPAQPAVGTPPDGASVLVPVVPLPADPAPTPPAATP